MLQKVRPLVLSIIIINIVAETQFCAIVFVFISILVVMVIKRLVKWFFVISGNRKNKNTPLFDLTGDLSNFGGEFYGNFDVVVISCCSLSTKV